MKKNSVLIIAEAGVNHNGDIDLAKQMINVAAESGADIVKFQAFSASRIVTPEARLTPYQINAGLTNSSAYSMLKDLELTREDHIYLKDYATDAGILLLSTGFDIADIKMLLEIGIKTIKIPSGEITNYPYLKFIGSLGLPIILSTGMSTLGDIELAISILESSGGKRNNITVLHCNSEYPTPMVDVNLKAMVNIGISLGVPVGYSDHTAGIEVPIAAVALGATVIEKHFTLDRRLPGPDHKASLEPDEFNSMVKSIRNIELALGEGIKRVSPSELKNLSSIRRSIVASTEIRAGEIFSENNLTVKRPGNGISARYWSEIIGQSASKDYKKDEQI